MTVQTERIEFRGGLTCICNVKWLPLIELVMLTRGQIKSNLDIWQLSYRNDVEKSKGTHARGGMTDLGQSRDDQIDTIREFGGTHQRREPPLFSGEAHGWPWGCPHLSDAGKKQAVQWENGLNGLAGNARKAIEGRYPVVKFQTGIRKAEKYLMAFKDDMADAVAQRVLELDGILENPDSVFSGIKGNDFVALKTAVKTLGQRQQRIEQGQITLSSQMSALATQLDAVAQLFQSGSRP